jgi:crotonobetainyl-CoA:carnitine CoA-transferase CaiB-like acyl-CoA transferase
MKLEGIRVLDLSLFLPGPHLTTMMADHGAEIIKIEPPGEGEPTRHIGLRAGGESVWWRNIGRGKKSIVLDLKSAPGREALLDLAETADVMVEAFRPGVMKRLGIDYDTVRTRNPRIVYASIAGFGQTGPLSLRPAHDIGMEAYAGVVSLNLGQDGQPTHPHMPVADITGSMMALSGILMALVRRQTTGQGDYLDISMHDSTMSWLPNATGPVFAEGRAPRVKEERSWGGHSFYNIYETSDGRHIVLAGVEHKFIRNLLTLFGREDLIEQAAQPPGQAHAAVKTVLQSVFITRTRDEWASWAEDKDICLAPVLDLHEAFHHPQLEARQMLIRDEAGQLHIGNPIRFRGEPARIDTRLPGYGEHTEQVLAELSKHRARATTERGD